jgi:iron complex transport system ATP-binding protein
LILDVSDLKYTYTNKSVIKNINFSVNKGEILAIMGVNGAGKSTLLKCINKILIPKTGNVIVNSKNIIELNLRDIAKLIGYVSQNCSYNSLTVFDHILLGRKPYINWDVSEKDLDIVNDIIKLLKLENYILRYVDQLSGGERQKVFIARALAQTPEILLLDEPTSSLDLKNQIEVIDTLQKIVKIRNTTIVVTIHDLNLAMRFADKFLLLKDGEIFSFGDIKTITKETIEEVYKIPVIVEKVGNQQIVIPA